MQATASPPRDGNGEQVLVDRIGKNSGLRADRRRAGGGRERNLHEIGNADPDDDLHRTVGGEPEPVVRRLERAKHDEHHRHRAQEHGVSVGAALRPIDAEGDRARADQLKYEGLAHEMRAEIPDRRSDHCSKAAIDAPEKGTRNVRHDDRDRGDRRPIGIVEIERHRDDHRKNAGERGAEGDARRRTRQAQLRKFALQRLGEAKVEVMPGPGLDHGNMRTRASAPMNSGTSGAGSNTNVT
jgi:hypothetical protein